MLAIHQLGRYHHAVNIAPAGDNALLVELGAISTAELHDVQARVARTLGASLLACIPGQSSLYVIFDGPHDIGAVRDALVDDSARPDTSLPAVTHRITVSFAGEYAPDLDQLLQRVTLGELLTRVATLRLRVRYIGFRGGFAYLDGWPEEWAMPRRPTSRPLVPRGSFAVAGAVAGFYPVDSPGGWNVLGRTKVNLAHAVAPGDEIVIEPTLEMLEFDEVERVPPILVLESAEVISAPLAVRIDPPDWSRVAHGVPPGGPFDDIAAAIASRAVSGKIELVECALAGPRIRMRRDAVIAWCGPDLIVRRQRVAAGEELTFGRISGGLRAYLAIGDGEGAIAHLDRGERHIMETVAGPHATAIGNIECEVTPQLDRVGIRLRPLRAIAIDVPADLPSCGMQFGTIQLHPDGSLVAMGPDHPITGGYLQPMTVLTSERWKLAQLMPGERVTFIQRPY